MEKSREARNRAEAIRTFLEYHQPKLPEARGFLQFILAKDEILRRIDLVEDLTGEPYAILVSAKGSGSFPFFYRRGDRYYNKTSQAVVELMRHVPDRIALYMSTDLPAWSEEGERFMRTMAQWRDDVFQDEVERIARRQRILDQIDEALAAGDRGSFKHLTDQLRQLG